MRTRAETLWSRQTILCLVICAEEARLPASTRAHAGRARAAAGVRPSFLKENNLAATREETLFRVAVLGSQLNPLEDTTMPSNHLQLSHERTFMKGLVLLAILGLGAASATQTVTATVVHPAASAPCGNGPTTELFANARSIVPAAALFGAFVVSKLQGPLAPVPNSRGDIRSFVDLAVERVVKEQHANQTWTDQEKAAMADQYYDTFTSGATAGLADGDMLDVWAEHVQFTKQYHQHAATLGHNWRNLIPAKYSSDASQRHPTHRVQVAGQTFPLPGMAEVQTKQGWTDDQLDRAIVGYGQFLRAMVAQARLAPSQPRLPLTPSHVVDEVWHQHIRHGLHYSKMGKAAHARYLHHAPLLRGADKATGPSGYARTLKLINDSGEAMDSWAWPPPVAVAATEGELADEERCSASGCGGGGCNIDVYDD